MIRAMFVPALCAAAISGGACATTTPVNARAVALAPDARNHPDHIPDRCNLQGQTDLCRGSGNTWLAYGVAAGAAAIVVLMITLAEGDSGEDR